MRSRFMPDDSVQTLEDGALAKLTPKQRAFVQEYLIDLNATQAAIRAGYAAKDAGQRAHLLLKEVEIANAVERGQAQRASRVKMTADTVLHELSLLANSSLEHYYVDDDGQIRVTPEAPDGAMRAIQSMKRRKTIKENRDGTVSVFYDVELRLWNKPEPLKLMGKHVGLKFNDRVEVSGPDGGPIVTKVLREVVDVNGTGGGS